MANKRKLKCVTLAVLVVALGLFACLGLSGCGRARILANPAAAVVALERNVIPGQQQPEEPQEQPEQAAVPEDDEPDELEEPQRADEQQLQTQPAKQQAKPKTSEHSSEPSEQKDDKSTQEAKKAAGKKKSHENTERGEDAEAASADDAAGTDKTTEGSGKKGAVVNQDTQADADSDNDQTKRDAEEQESDTTDTMSMKLKAYTSYIDSKHQVVFPCQQTNVYCEKVEDYQAAHKPSAENRAILAIEAVNVGEAKTDTVSAAWMHETNPGLIVKLVDNDVLGSGVTSTDRAESVAADILAREGWADVDAIQHRDVVLANAGLLASDDGAMLFKLYLAMYIYPDAYADIVEQGGIDYIYKDIYGTDPDGVYFYALNG